MSVLCWLLAHRDSPFYADCLNRPKFRTLCFRFVVPSSVFQNKEPTNNTHARLSSQPRSTPLPANRKQITNRRAKNDGSSVKNSMRRYPKSPGSQPAAEGASICVGARTELAHTAPAPANASRLVNASRLYSSAMGYTRGSSARPARTCGEHQHTQSQLWENRAGLRFLGVC